MKVPKGILKDVEIGFNKTDDDEKSKQVKVIITSQVFSDNGELSLWLCIKYVYPAQCRNSKVSIQKFSNKKIIFFFINKTILCILMTGKQYLSLISSLTLNNQFGKKMLSSWAV